MLLGLIVNLILAIPAVIILLVVSSFFASAAQTPLFNFLYGSLLVVELYVLNALSGVIAVKMPQVIGYALILSEILKVAAIVPLALILRLGVSGAITAYAIANIVQILIYTFAIRELWSEKLSFKYWSQWTKASPLNLLNAGSATLASLLPYVALFNSGPLALAYYGAAITLTTPINYSQSLTAALYPKLLAGGTSRDIEILWRLSLMFSLPLTLAIVFLSPSLLAVLNVAYVPSYITVIIFSISFLFFTLSGFFNRIIFGTEKLDLGGAVAMRDLARSRVTKASITGFMINGVALLLIWLWFKTAVQTPILAAEAVALISLMGNVVSAAVQYVWAQRCIAFHFPRYSALKYCAAAGVLVLVVPFIRQPMRYFLTIPLFMAGTAAYFLLVYVFDEEARVLLKDIYRYIGSFISYREASPGRV